MQVWIRSAVGVLLVGLCATQAQAVDLPSFLSRPLRAIGRAYQRARHTRDAQLAAVAGASETLVRNAYVSTALDFHQIGLAVGRFGRSAEVGSTAQIGDYNVSILTKVNCTERGRFDVDIGASRRPPSDCRFMCNGRLTAPLRASYPAKTISQDGPVHISEKTSESAGQFGIRLSRSFPWIRPSASGFRRTDNVDVFLDRVTMIIDLDDFTESRAKAAKHQAPSGSSK